MEIMNEPNEFNPSHRQAAYILSFGILKALDVIPEDVSHLVEYLPSVHKALNSILGIDKLGMAIYVCNSST